MWTSCTSRGPPCFPACARPTRRSTDVDVLVRPSHLHRLIAALEGAGWDKRTDFATGSVFAHAANWWHDDWGWVDVHVHWPGVRVAPETAFDIWSRDALLHPIAHVDCPVPGRTAQLLVLVLHAARSTDRSDVDYAWARASDEERAAARDLARTLDAEVALAAALGELEQFRHDPCYALWKHLSEGGQSRVAEWRARFRATPGARGRAQLLGQSFRVNRDHLGMELGRAPTRLRDPPAPAPARAPCLVGAADDVRRARVTTYEIAPDIAWVSRDEYDTDDRPVAYVATLPHGPTIVLEGPACLVWLALAEGGTLEEIVATTADQVEETSDAMTRDVEALLNRLVELGFACLA